MPIICTAKERGLCSRLMGVRPGQDWAQLVLCSAREVHAGGGGVGWWGGSHHMLDGGCSESRCGSYQEKPSCEIILRVESPEAKSSLVSAKKLRNCKTHITLQTEEGTQMLSLLVVIK